MPLLKLSILGSFGAASSYPICGRSSKEFRSANLGGSGAGTVWKTAGGENHDEHTPSWYLRTLFFCGLVLCLLAGSVRVQIDRATPSGTVDLSGAVIRDADIEVSDEASGIETKAEIQVVYKDHSRIVDLMDSITELRPLYRAEWLDEYAAYRLASAFGRWDANMNTGEDVSNCCSNSPIALTKETFCPR